MTQSNLTVDRATPTRHLPLALTIVALTAARTIVNFTRRFTYATVPGMARSLGVTEAAVQNVVALQGGVGVTSPAFGSLSERYGRKRVMMAMLVMMALAGVVGALLPQFAVFAIVMVLFGAGKMIYDPTNLAYIGDRVPYQRRGLAVGVNELSWALSLLIAAPVAGVLLTLAVSDTAWAAESLLIGGAGDRLFRTPDGVAAIMTGLAVSCLVGAALVLVFVPADKPPRDPNRVRRNPLRVLQTALREQAALLRTPIGRGVMGYAGLTAIANDIIFINYAIFMEDTYALGAAALGVFTIVIAAAEILGEFSVIGLADRFGKKRLALLGAVVAGLSYAVLPFLTFSLPVTLACLFVMFLGVEIGIVAGVVLFSEVTPEARAVTLSGVVGAASIGRMVGGVAGAALLVSLGDFRIVGGIAAVIALVGAWLLWRYVNEN